MLLFLIFIRDGIVFAGATNLTLGNQYNPDFHDLYGFILPLYVYCVTYIINVLWTHCRDIANTFVIILRILIMQMSPYDYDRELLFTAR